MLQVQIWVAVLVPAIVAVATFGVVKFLDRLRKMDAENEAKRILGEAERQATTKVKEAELSIREKELTQKAEAEKYLNKSRDDIRERERSLDKRQELLQQQNDDLRKQEKIAETTQRE